MFKSGLFFIVSQIIVFLSIPLLTRAYSIAQFAEFAAFLTIYIIASSLSTLRLADALVKAPASEKDHIASVSVYLSLFLSMISFVVALAYGMSVLHAAICAMAVVLQSISRILYFLMVRGKEFALASFSQAILNVGTIFGQIALARFDVGLYFGLLVGLSVAVLSQLYSRRFVLFKISLRAIIDIIRRYPGNSRYLSLFTLVGVVRTRIPYMIMGTSSAAGLLSQFERVTNAPKNLVSAILRPVFFSSVNKADIGQSANAIIIPLLWLFGVFAAVLLALVEHYHETLVAFIFGQEWASNSLYFYYILMGSLCLFPVSFLDRFFDIIEKQNIIFVLEVMFIVILLGTMLAFGNLPSGLGFFYAMALSAFIFTVAFCAIIFWFSKISLLYLGLFVFSLFVLNLSFSYLVEHILYDSGPIYSVLTAVLGLSIYVFCLLRLSGLLSWFKEHI